jgi:hypothetical protein
MVNVNPNKWNVKVIGIHSPPSGSEDQNRLPLFAVPCRFSAATTEYHKFFSISTKISCAGLASVQEIFSVFMQPLPALLLH